MNLRPSELRDACEEIYGEGWQTALAADLGKHPLTVSRWMAGKNRFVPRYAAAYVKARLDTMRTAKRHPAYDVIITQGQGPALRFGLFRSEARNEFINLLGQAAVAVRKDGRALTFKQACQEFELDPDTAQAIVEKYMEINRLYADLIR